MVVNSAALHFQHDLLLEKMAEELRFGCHPLADGSCGRVEEVHLDDEVRTADGRVLDALDATIDQNEGPPLLVEDLGLVGSGEQGFATRGAALIV